VIGKHFVGMLLGGLVVVEPGIAVGSVEDPFRVVEHKVILGVLWFGHLF
jgi:hypothetical protein